MSNIRNEKFKKMNERIKSLSLGENERFCFGELKRLIEDYKDTILFKKLFNDSLNVKELREKLNSYYDENSFIDDDCIVDDYFNNSLINIENDLAIFEQENCAYNNDSRIELLSIFSSGLGDACYFGDNRIVDGTSYGVELVSRICDILANKSLMDELTSVVSISNTLFTYSRVKHHFQRVLDNRDKLYDNIDLICEYSSLKKQLSGEPSDIVSSFYDIPFFQNQEAEKERKLSDYKGKLFKTEFDKKEITELEREITGLKNRITSLREKDSNIHKKIEKVGKEFEEKGIQDLVFADYQGNVNGDVYLLENVSSKEELDSYLDDCQDIIGYYDTLYDEVKKTLEEKMKSISSEARELLKNNFLTCGRIVRLTEQKNDIGIRKDYCLFALDVLLNLNSMTYDDFDFDFINDEKTSKFIDSKREKIDSFCDEQVAKLNAIVHPKNNSLSEFVKK